MNSWPLSDLGRQCTFLFRHPLENSRDTGRQGEGVFTSVTCPFVRTELYSQQTALNYSMKTQPAPRPVLCTACLFSEGE